jgi:hypothetical protein
MLPLNLAASVRDHQKMRPTPSTMFRMRGFASGVAAGKRPPGRRLISAAACAVAMLASAAAAPLKPSLEDRYIATRDAAIERLQPIFDAGNAEDAADKAEDAVRVDLQAQMTAILGELKFSGFGPARLNLDTLYKSDQGFGMLDGLRFDAEVGKAGARAGSNGADGNYVEPRAHIIVTTPTLFAGWLRAHKDWLDKGLPNVPQQIGAALKDGSFYTQAISTDAAVINFNTLPIARPASATSAYGMLAGRTQSEIPDQADEVFVSAITGDRVYIAYGSIEPSVRIPACIAIRAGYNKRAEQGDDDFRFKKIDKKAYDRLGNLRQQGEDAFRLCFTRRAPQQPSFAAATQQAQELLAAAMQR